jgi:hypothetical protein
VELTGFAAWQASITIRPFKNPRRRFQKNKWHPEVPFLCLSPALQRVPSGYKPFFIYML